jgi:hypothetical protein
MSRVPHSARPGLAKTARRSGRGLAGTPKGKSRVAYSSLDPDAGTDEPKSPEPRSTPLPDAPRTDESGQSQPAEEREGSECGSTPSVEPETGVGPKRANISTSMPPGGCKPE